MARPGPSAHLEYLSPTPRYPSAGAARTMQDRPPLSPGWSEGPLRRPRGRGSLRPTTRRSRPPRRHPHLAYSSTKSCRRTSRFTRLASLSTWPRRSLGVRQQISLDVRTFGGRRLGPRPDLGQTSGVRPPAIPNRVPTGLPGRGRARDAPRTRHPALECLLRQADRYRRREFGIHESDGAPDAKEGRPKHNHLVTKRA
jgi:hypothetical protein